MLEPEPEYQPEFEQPPELGYPDTVYPESDYQGEDFSTSADQP